MEDASIGARMPNHGDSMSSLPARVNLTYDLACEFLSFLKCGVDTEPGDLNLLCLQGVTPDANGHLALNDNRPDIYNDTVSLVYRTEDNQKAIRHCVGTTDPGRYYTENPMSAGGAAHLTFGQHLYKSGPHKGYPALRSLNELNRLWRDANGNFKPDIGEAVVESYAGVNVHAGGKTMYIGRWSAGCINIAGGFDGEPYQHFIQLVNIHSEDKRAVRVTVWRGIDLFKFAQLGWNHRPTLVMGMKNGWVVELQRLLRAKGIRTSIDGDWRGGTSRSVVQFQKAAGLTPDGWVGPKTWAALLS